MRDELLNESLFLDLDQARKIVTAWVADYNTRRPHSSLGYSTPAAYAAHLSNRGHLPIQSRSLRGGFGPNRLVRRHVFVHDLLALLRRRMPMHAATLFLNDLVGGCMMPLLDVLRGLRLRLFHVLRGLRPWLHRLSSLWAWCGGRGLRKCRSAQAQSSYGGECECKLVHGGSPWDRGRKRLCVIVEGNLSLLIHLITNSACM
jgi:transposase InsO family protein